MIWIRGLLIIPQVAGNALCWESLKNANRRALMALLTLHGGMRSKKWEPVLVILDLLDGYIPPAHGVALCAVGPELPAVYVSVAIGTVLSYISKYRFCMALRALHFFVHPAQRIICVVVVEFRIRPDRAPGVCCMAIFARDHKRPVWAACSFFLGDGWDSQPD
jgi:hypothetical protein